MPSRSSRPDSGSRRDATGARVNTLEALSGESDDPVDLVEPSDPVRNECVLNSPEREEQADQLLLALHANHFHLTMEEQDISEVIRNG